VSRFIGITGGIATGKSTVTKMFRELGAHVIDADDVARRVVEPGSEALAEIAARWPGVVAADGTLDRKALGARVFNSPADRKALDAITHPRIQAWVLERTRELYDRGEKVVFYDAALIFENGLQHAMNGVVLVVCAPETQLKRLRARNTLTEDEAKARIGSQMPLEEKKKLARWIIDNEGSLDETRAQVEKVWREVTA
jgi:dephospho-CoA kinase